jgi:hypothetical protein
MQHHAGTPAHVNLILKANNKHKIRPETAKQELNSEDLLSSAPIHAGVAT